MCSFAFLLLFSPTIWLDVGRGEAGWGWTLRGGGEEGRLEKAGSWKWPNHVGNNSALRSERTHKRPHYLGAAPLGQRRLRAPRSPQRCRFEKTIQSRLPGEKHPLVLSHRRPPNPSETKSKRLNRQTVAAEECSRSPRGLLVLCQPCAFKRLMNTAVR